MLVFICSIVILGSSFADAASWSYHGETGPAYWSTLDGGENCGGSSQSPINIDHNIEVDQEFPEWELIGFDGTESEGPRPTSILNNGHSVQVNLEEAGFFVSGGGLPSEYEGVQIHLHWGYNSSHGSEHTSDGQAYPAELHIVTYDHLTYPFVPLAIDKPQGLAVLGFFLEVGEHNAAWDPIVNALSQVQFDGDRYDFPEFFKLSELIPSDLNEFHRYNGSLTTPGCYESVVWTVFEETIKVSEEQLEAFRGLSELTAEELEESEIDILIVDNYRPVQPLNGRTLYHGYTAGNDPHDFDASCHDRCGEAQDDNAPCQCNSVCREYGDCCQDYKELCLVEVCSFVPTFKDKQRKQPQGLQAATYK